jgi:ribosomal 50S subunit-recycling heat shock protein
MSQVAEEAAKETVKQIQELAVKPNKTVRDNDLLRDLLKKHSQQNIDIARAQSRQRSAEAAQLRQRAAQTGLSAREQFIQDNNQRFIDTARRLGNQNALTMQLAADGTKVGTNTTNTASTGISGVALSNITEEKSEVAKAGRGRLALKKAIKDKEQELSDILGIELGIRNQIQIIDQRIAENLQRIAQLRQVIAQFTDPTTGVIVREAPNFVYVYREQIKGIQQNIDAMQAEKPKRLAELPDILEERAVIEQELEALRSELQDLEKHIKNLTGVTDPRIPVLTDIVSDEILQEGNGVLEEGIKVIDDTGRTFFVDAEGREIAARPAVFRPFEPVGLFEDIGAFGNLLQQSAGAAVGELGREFEAGIMVFREKIVEALKPVANLMKGIGRITPDTAIEQAFLVAGQGMLVNFGIYTLATATDLLHPLKGTGIVPVAIDIARGIGPDLLSRTTVQAFADTAFALPIRYKISETVRGFRPSGAIADQLYFEGNISLEDWRQSYRWQGWPEAYIDAWYRTMFTEPSDRILIDLFKLVQIPKDWIRSKLKERGYSSTDVEVIQKAAEEISLERLSIGREAIIITRVKEGFITSSQARDELAALGMDEKRIKRVIAGALLALDTEMRKDRLNAASTAFRQDRLSREEYISILADLIPNPSMRRRILENDEFKKAPKIKGS